MNKTRVAVTDKWTIQLSALKIEYLRLLTGAKEYRRITTEEYVSRQRELLEEIRRVEKISRGL